MTNQELKMPERKGKFKDLDTGVLHYNKPNTISPIDVEYIKTWEYIDKTPAYGEAYFNQHGDMAAIIYRDKVKVYFNREFKGKTASCFKDCIVYDKEITNDYSKS